MHLVAAAVAEVGESGPSPRCLPCGCAGAAQPRPCQDREAAMTEDPTDPLAHPDAGAEHAADVTALIDEILHRPVDVDVTAHPQLPVHEAVSGQAWFEQAADGLCAPASV